MLLCLFEKKETIKLIRPNIYCNKRNGQKELYKVHEIKMLLQKNCIWRFFYKVRQ